MNLEVEIVAFVEKRLEETVLTEINRPTAVRYALAEARTYFLHAEEGDFERAEETIFHLYR